jgi:nicotinamide-nucleotide amidase
MVSFSVGWGPHPAIATCLGSAEAAGAMAAGARAALGVDVAVAATGVAGPGGGSPEKPVGLVHLHVSAPAGGKGREFSLPGDRGTIRARATVASLHLARTVLTRSRHKDE